MYCAIPPLHHRAHRHKCERLLPALNTALYGPNQHNQPHSILSPTERLELLDLAQYFKGLFEEYDAGNAVSTSDLTRWTSEILEPYRELIPGDWPVFALDLLRWYAESVRATIPRPIQSWFESGVASTERVRGVTYVAQGNGDTSLSKMMQVFDFLIRKLSINEEVLQILTRTLGRQN